MAAAEPPPEGAFEWIAGDVFDPGVFEEEINLFEPLFIGIVRHMYDFEGRPHIILDVDTDEGDIPPDFLNIEDFNYFVDDDFGPYWTIRPNSNLFNSLPENITHYRFYPNMIHINNFEMGYPSFGWVRTNQEALIPSELYYSSAGGPGSFGKRRINIALPMRLRRQAEKLGIRLVVSRNNRSIFKSPTLLRKQIKNELRKQKTRKAPKKQQTSRPRRCKAITKKGTRCKHKALHGKYYCGHH